MTALKTQAIQTALTGNWEEAIALNQAILEENPDDIDAINRLAFAYGSLGDIKEAKNLYQKVLSLDMHNPIATRNLRRFNGNINIKTFPSTPVSLSNLFIEEPGKTKVVELINITDKKTLNHVRSGEKIELVIKRMKIFVYDNQKQFIGMLPDDLSRRLTKFMEIGNVYEAYIKHMDNNKVTVFIREIKRVNRLKNQPSFIAPTSPEKTKISIKTFIDEERQALPEPEEDL
ncbi:MAG TPA: tetratricopeptide repeat protein [Patescibacteria group bacterium]|nr:tetratricopeptide repeat protein [Patescibacteria group bacterium]